MKAKVKATKKAARRVQSSAKSVRLKVKRARSAAQKPANPAAGIRPKTVASVELRGRSAAAATQSRFTSPERERSKHFTSAVQAYEAGIKAMHAEDFQEAIRFFKNLIADHSDEPEIVERARVFIHASEKKIHKKGRAILRSADDYYNVGIADLNRRALDSAVQHFQHALKLAPKADHVLYALAAANALHGNRDQALQNLKQAIHHRPENRFLAVRDTDFDPLREDADFKQLVMSPEK